MHSSQSLYEKKYVKVMGKYCELSDFKHWAMLDSYQSLKDKKTNKYPDMKIH